MELIGFVQACVNCREEFKNKLKLENCPVCGLKFEYKYTYEYFRDLKMRHKPTHINLCYCDSCKIRYDTDKALPCPKCGQPPTSTGVEMIDYAYSFWDYIKINFLP